MIMSCGSTAYAEEVEHYFNDDGSPMTGMHYINHSMLILDSDGAAAGTYSGYTNNSKGTRYYDRGRRICGWYKTEDGWKYFDDKGYMSIGKTKICGVNYYFDDNGVWTGKYGKNGKAPDDFNVYFKYDSFVGYDGFDSSSLELFYPQCYTTNYEGEWLVGNISRDIKISQRDKQVLYCMFLESGLADADLSRDLDDKYLHEFMDKYNRDENGYIEKFNDMDHMHEDGRSQEETAISEITVTADGRTYSVRYCYHLIRQLAERDETSGAVIFFNDRLSYYNAALKKKFPQTYSPAPESEVQKFIGYL